jgi:methyltransferase, ubiE/COQ5 family
MASTPLHDKLKAPFRDDARTDSNGILRCLDRTAVTGDNQRYMSMYDWMARWYDFGERWIGKLKYGDGIPNMRRQLMQELPWRNGCSALYVSIGTGADLRYLPASIDPATLDLVGLDISLGMLRRCRRAQFELKEIITAIPAGMQDVNTQLIWNNRFYCITFRTPDIC